MGRFVRWLADYHSLRVGGNAAFWSDRKPGIQVEMSLRCLWRGHIWLNRDEHRLMFGWGDGYQDEALTVWIRYWPMSKARVQAKAEEVPF